MKDKCKDNGQQLRELIEASGLTQQAALDRINEGQMRPVSVSQWKAYLSMIDSARRSPCPDTVLNRAKELFGEFS